MKKSTIRFHVKEVERAQNKSVSRAYMFKNKKKEVAPEAVPMCSESSSLWEKLHNLPYLLSHKKALCIYMAAGFLFDMLKFSIILFLWQFIQVEIRIALGVLL